MRYRYKFIIEYDGVPFKGWQRQAGVPTVQGALEDALVKLIGLKVVVEGAGRTDAGVHAWGQVGHMEVPKALDAAKLREGLNFYVGPSIAVVAVEEVPLDFHARFSAVGRRYEYIIMNRRAHSALWHKRAWHVMKPLDADIMHQAAQHFVGRHDFSAFRAAACQGGSAIKNLSFFNVWREGELIKAEVSAPSFLHNQVRIMMGTLKMVGEGTWEGSHISSLLRRGDRTQAGPTAPPYGLYFKGAYYTTEKEV